MSKFCSKCGREILNDDKFCMYCGNSTNTIESKEKEENTEQVNQSQNNSVNTTQNQPNVIIQNTPNKYTNGFGIAGFVISLVSLLICCGSFSWLSLIFSIIGLVNANKNNGEGKGLSIAGIIISSIVVVLVIVFYIISISAEVIAISEL